jgi:replicative DNA helicase
MQRLRTGRMEESDWTRLTRSLGKLAEAPLFIDDSASVTMMEIRAKCRRLKQRHGLGLVIVDYLQLMQPAKRFDNRQQEVSEISRSLKLLAKELEVPVVAISQLSRQPESRSDRRPLLSDLRESGCLTADTRIARADTGAEVSLGELLARGERNIPVWTLDNELRLVRGTMTHVFPSGTKPVFELRLASGRHVKASANHPFLTLDGWRPLAQLAVGDRLGVPRTTPEPSDATAWPDPEIVMMAHMLGDGCFASRQPIHYTSEDPANLLDIRGRVKRVQKAGYRPGYHLYLYGAENQLRFLELAGIHGARGVAAEPLTTMLRMVLPKANTNIDTIPKEIWTAVRPRMREVGFTTRAFPAAIGTQFCGSALYKAAPGRTRLARIASVLEDDRLARLAGSDVFWDSIEAIEPLGEQPVYDATVLDTHNFIANGIIAHNSLEQDADVVLFIYRDELYDRETERKGEADLILAKHRNGPTDTVVVTFQGQYSRFFPMAPRSM